MYIYNKRLKLSQTLNKASNFNIFLQEMEIGRSGRA